MEGCDADNSGKPGPLTLRRYKRFASGGAGLIWAEAIAVAPEGRANPRQLWLNDNNKSTFAQMITDMRAVAHTSISPTHNPVIVAQLTHSGRYSKPLGTPQPLIPVNDPYRDPLTPEPTPTTKRPSRIPSSQQIITDQYLDNLQQQYVAAAKLAFEVGFDAIDIKSCHGYLINELLAAHTRTGKYGGSFENRTRFLLEVIDKIRLELGDVPITLRLGIYDAIPYPFGWAVDKNDYTKPDLTEPKKLIALLQQRDINIINITVANPYYNPHIGRPFNQPTADSYPEPEHPIVGVNRLISLTADIQQAFPKIAVVASGYSWLRHLLPNVAAATKSNKHATIIGAGRMAFAYPDFAKDIINTGSLDPNKTCIGCSACTQMMRDGTTAGCVVRDAELYKPIFQRARRSNRDHLAQLASACLQCQDPTCKRGCPAAIDIPTFIRQFINGDERAAYDTIAKSNALPELCANLCPVEHQCQGNCIQQFIGQSPVPIADIQRYLAHRANSEGWSKLNIPKNTTSKHIAIIGAGPAAIAATTTLLKAGHKVTIFDKQNQLGGIVQSVIPDSRQFDSLQHELNAILSDIPSDRLTLKSNTPLTPDFNLDSIMNQGFDAAFIALGLPQALTTSKQPTKGVYNAIDFLAAAKTSNNPISNGKKLSLTGKTVAVIGGGNSAMDAAVVTVELDATHTYLIYRRSFTEMPAWTTERDLALKKGVHFLILTHHIENITDDNNLTALKLCPTTLGEPDKSGRRRPIPIESSQYTLKADILIEAIGQQSSPDLDEILKNVTLDNGLIKTKPDSLETSRQNVFAGGDIVKGPSTVVAAVADGMNAANEIINRFK